MSKINLNKKEEYVDVYAGKCGEKGYLDGPIEIAKFNNPIFVAVDALQNLFVLEHPNCENSPD